MKKEALPGCLEKLNLASIQTSAGFRTGNWLLFSGLVRLQILIYCIYRISNLWRGLKMTFPSHLPSNLIELDRICHEDWDKLPKIPKVNKCDISEYSIIDKDMFNCIFQTISVKWRNVHIVLFGIIVKKRKEKQKKRDKEKIIAKHGRERYSPNRNSLMFLWYIIKKLKVQGGAILILPAVLSYFNPKCVCGYFFTPSPAIIRAAITCCFSGSSLLLL